MKTIICRNCNSEFPATTDYFYRQKGAKYGLRKICKSCKKKEDKQYHINNQEQIILQQRDYNNKNRKKINAKNREFYARNKERIKKRRKELRDSLPEDKKKQISLKMKCYYGDNEDKLKRYANSYRRTEKGRLVELKAKHTRKAREQKLPAALDEATWENCLEDFNYKCAYCGITEAEHIKIYSQRLHQEHFIPLSKGGEYTHNNIIPSCRSCNAKKHNIDFFEWYPEQEFYSKERNEKILEYLGYKNKNIQQLSIL